jgi:release factor glutamine methyltransferase
MSIFEAARAGAGQLRASGIETPELDAEVLMRHLLGQTQVEYFLHRNEPIPETTLREFEALIAQRIGRVSVAYIVGKREFMDLTFRVGPGVLVPRPETETMVLMAAGWLVYNNRLLARVVDVGTGSGAIAISLCHRAPREYLGEVVGIDSSPRALGWAKENLATLGSHHVPIRFELGHLLAPIDKPVDIVLANLPYLTPEQVAENPDLAAEPIEALVSGLEGLDLIRELLADLGRVLAPDGMAMLEIDPAQSNTLRAEASRCFPEARVLIEQDLSGRDRFLFIDRGVTG